jgi:hypothetical protein
MVPSLQHAGFQFIAQITKVLKTGWTHPWARLFVVQDFPTKRGAPPLRIPAAGRIIPPLPLTQTFLAQPQFQGILLIPPIPKFSLTPDAQLAPA